jgi:hypothetical protein
MSKELLYLGIGAAAAYLFTRARKSAPAVALSSKAPTVVPGFTPGTTPRIAPDPFSPDPFSPINKLLDKEGNPIVPKSPQGLDANGNIVFGSDDGGSLTVPSTVPDTIVAIQNYAKAGSMSLADAYSIFLDNAISQGKQGDIQILHDAWSKMNSPVAKAGIGMAATVALLATGYYFIANR